MSLLHARVLYPLCLALVPAVLAGSTPMGTGSAARGGSAAAGVHAAVANLLALLDARSPGARGAATYDTKFRPPSSAASAPPAALAADAAPILPALGIPVPAILPAAAEPPALPSALPGPVAGVWPGQPGGVAVLYPGPVPGGWVPGGPVGVVPPPGGGGVPPVQPPGGAVPEPTSWAMLLLGSVALGAQLRLRRRRACARA